MLISFGAFGIVGLFYAIVEVHHLVRNLITFLPVVGIWMKNWKVKSQILES